MRKTIVTGLLALTCASAATAQSFRTGQWVLARASDGTTNMYPGVVKAASAKAVTVSFDDGTTETRAIGEVRPYNWSNGTKIYCVWSGDGKVYGAVITSMAADGVTLGIRYIQDSTTDTVKTGACYSK